MMNATMKKATKKKINNNNNEKNSNAYGNNKGTKE